MILFYYSGLFHDNQFIEKKKILKTKKQLIIKYNKINKSKIKSLKKNNIP